MSHTAIIVQILLFRLFLSAPPSPPISPFSRIVLPRIASVLLLGRAVGSAERSREERSDEICRSTLVLLDRAIDPVETERRLANFNVRWSLLKSTTDCASRQYASVSAVKGIPPYKVCIDGRWDALCRPISVINSEAMGCSCGVGNDGLCGFSIISPAWKEHKFCSSVEDPVNGKKQKDRPHYTIVTRNRQVHFVTASFTTSYSRSSDKTPPMSQLRVEHRLWGGLFDSLAHYTIQTQPQNWSVASVLVFSKCKRNTGITVHTVETLRPKQPAISFFFFYSSLFSLNLF